MNYVANVEQTPRVLEGMRQMISIYPGIGALLCVAILVAYPLDGNTLKRIEADLESRAGSASDLDELPESPR